MACSGIPRGWELPGDEAVMRKDRGLLIIDPQGRARSSSSSTAGRTTSARTRRFPRSTIQPPGPSTSEMGYLLDTNIISDLVRYRQGAAARQIRAHAEADLLTSIIVAAELRFGPA